MDKEVAEIELQSAITFSKEIKEIDAKIARELAELNLSGGVGTHFFRQVFLTLDRLG